MKDGNAGQGVPRWFDAGAVGVSQKAALAAGLSLGVFLFALESERLPALMNVGGPVGMPPLTTLIPCVILGVCVALLMRGPLRRPVPLGWPVAVAAACSIALAGRYCLLDGLLPGIPRTVWGTLYALTTPALVFFWVQRAMPFGRAFVVRSFGSGAIVLGCLTLLVMAFERSIALWLVAVLPFAGVALLPLVDVAAAPPAFVPAEPATGEREPSVWRSAGPAGRLLFKLMPFLCYAIVFGNVHFSWVDLQDGGTVNAWVQTGAAVGSIICGIAALSLARLHWGHALESLIALLLTSFALVALWLSTFLTSGYAFAYLVLLNIAQKLTFLLMLLFGFPFSRDGRSCASLWSLAYFSFFMGTCVSCLAGAYAEGGLNVIAAVALAVVFIVDVADIIMLYGGDRSRLAGGFPEGVGPEVSSGTGKAAVAPGADGEAAASLDAGGVRAVEGFQPGGGTCNGPSATGPGFDALSQTCSLIARQYGLTRREEEILQLLMRGRSAARIAETLCITVATARTHQRNIYAKLDVHTQQDILDLCDKYGIGPGDR